MSNPNELLWLVNDQDEPLGSLARGKIHAQKLLHRSVHILVFNPEGQVLLQLRAMSKDENPGLWDSSAAGHVDYGERYDASAVREIREELGITIGVDKLGFLFKMGALPEFGNEFVQVYQVRWGGAVQPEAGEITDVRWFEPGEMDAALSCDDPALTGTLKRIWRLYRNSSVAATPTINNAK